MKYYSEKLKTMFDTPEALKTAEEAEEKKALAIQNKDKQVSSSRRDDAYKVSDAFKACNRAYADYQAAANSAMEEYKAAIKKAGDIYASRVADKKTALEGAKKAYDTALNDFIKKYPEGYHLTLRDGDNYLNLDVNNSSTEVPFHFWDDFNKEFFGSLVDSFEDLLNF